MSGFFGIFRPDGQQINIDQFDQMKSAMPKDGCDRIETHLEENFAVGHLMLRVGNASEYDKQPLKSECGSYILAGHFRLDYRDDLGDKLGLTQKELEVTSDSKLVLMAILKWKEKCVNHLEGDWAFIFFDKKANCLKFLKDSTGISSLFYFKTSSSIYFSSDPTVFRQVSNLKFELSIENFKSILIFGKSKKRNTLFENLFYLLHGEIISIDFKGNFTYFKYHNFNIKSVLQFKNDDDYIFEYYSVFNHAVHVRLLKNEKNSIFLSGGKDSSSVCYFASKFLEQEGGLIFGFCSVPLFTNVGGEFQGKIVDETPYVSELKHSLNNLNLELCNFPKIDFVSLFELNSRNPFNPLLTKNTFWLNGILEKVKRCESRNCLTGQMGNYTITFNGFYVYSDMLLRLKLFTLFKEIVIQSKKTKQSFLFLFNRQVLIPLRQYFKFWLKNVIKFEHFDLYYINSKFLKKPGVYFKAKYLYNSLLSLLNTNKNNRVLHLISVLETTTNIWYFNGLNFGIVISDPTGDRRVIDFLHSIPQHLFFKLGVSKFIYRAAMKNKIPDLIITNDHYQHQSFDFEERFRSDENLHSYILNLDSRGDAFNLFDTKKVIQSFEQIDRKFKKAIPKNEINYVLRNISLKYFCIFNSNS